MSIFIYLQGKYNEKENKSKTKHMHMMEREREIDHISASSLREIGRGGFHFLIHSSNAYNSQIRVKNQEPETDSTWISHTSDRKPRAQAIFS